MYWVISSWLDFVNWTRSKLIAIELAREWMEAVYNIRDTNWTRWSWKRDQCWLKNDPLKDSNSEGCQDDPWIWSGEWYVVKQEGSTQRYWMLSWVSWQLNIFDWIDSTDRKFQLCNNWKYWYSCSWSISNSDLKQWRYFRWIYTLWLIDKQNDTYLSCSNWTSCWDSSAKELRFCSIVQFFNWKVGQVKFCWVLTNFKP